MKTNRLQSPTIDTKTIRNRGQLPSSRTIRGREETPRSEGQYDGRGWDGQLG